MTNTKNRHIHRLTQLLLMGILCLLGACASRSEEEPEGPETANCKVRLYVSLMGGLPTASGTRADSPWDTPGEGFENRIDLSDYRVYLFTSDDNKLIAHLTDEETSKQVEFTLDKTTDETIYKIEFRVDEIIEDVENTLKSFKMVILANWGNSYPENLVTGETTLSDLITDGSCIADFDKDGILTKIPFYGVQRFDNVTLQTEGVSTLDKPLHLLRALAKIEVYDADDTDFKMDKVTLRRYNAKFHQAPHSVTEGEHYISTTPGLSIPDTSTEETKDLIVKRRESDGHYIIYVPEYRNIGRDSDSRSRLIIHYPEDDKEFTAEFKYYNNPPAGSFTGDYYDLHRNYWYELIVKRTHIMEFIVDVIPFTQVDLNPDFGLDRNDYGFIKGITTITNADGTTSTVDCWYDQNYYEGVLDEEGKPIKPITYFLGPNKTGTPQLVHGYGPVETIDATTGTVSVTYIPKDYLLVYSDGDDYDNPVFEKAYLWGFDDDGNWGRFPVYDENGQHMDSDQVNSYEQISGFERKSSTLHMVIDVETAKRYILTPQAITGYPYSSNGGFYLNQLKQRVMLDSNLMIKPPDKTLPDGVFLSHRAVFEWDMMDWANAAWDRLKDYYPKAWFDVFGTRYDWEEGDSKEKREQLLRSKYGDLVDYLEGNPYNTNQ